jgi:DNA (cytosine-5)-methyltransferase 1
MKFLSLFSCSGISEYYLDRLDINIVVANELLEDRGKVYKHIYPDCNMIVGDIKQKYKEIIELCKQKNVEGIIATPPCQSFSNAGKKLDDDPRSPLFYFILKIMKEINPKYVIIENVPTFLTTKIGDKKIIDIITEEVGDRWEIIDSVLDAQYYETPQTRKRSISLFSRKDCKVWKLPKKFIKNPITVQYTIGHLPSLESEEVSTINPFHYASKHNQNHILWMKHTPTGQTAFSNELYFPQKENGDRIKGYNTTYKRINWNKPCYTITMANGSISSQNNVHPGRLLDDGTYSDARVLTIYEIIMLTGLDDRWSHLIKEYKDNNNLSDNKIRQLIGESFPPKFCFHIFKTLPIS